MKKLQEVSILRTFAVITLVAWHSYCSYTSWQIGNSPADDFYRYIFYFLSPDANMPLFTFLSGYLFAYLLVEKEKYNDFKAFVINKSHRLLIPYLILGFVINMTQIDRQNPLELFWGTPNHLWYCLMLFYCFIGCWIVEKKFGMRWNIAVMLLSFLIVVVMGNQNLMRTPLGVYMPMYYYGYFYIGFLAFRYKEQLLSAVGKWWWAVLCIYILTAYFTPLRHFLLITSLSYIALLLKIGNSERFQQAIVNNSLINLGIEKISQYSFGIYVFHQWIIWNMTRYDDFHPFIHEHYILFPLLTWCLIFFLSYLITHYAVKTRIGRYLLM